jgi:pyruvate/2-oxoglutarate dehydrogenase complex dihydrolipoamide acyltransferase (E2) component
VVNRSSASKAGHHKRGIYEGRIGNIEIERNHVNITMNILRLPDLGASTGEAEVVVWLKTVGESITVGEPVLEVQSDKANVEVEATLSGTLARVLAEEGKILKPGDPLAVIAEPDEPRDAAAIDRALVELNS